MAAAVVLAAAIGIAAGVVLTLLVARPSSGNGTTSAAADATPAANGPGARAQQVLDAWALALKQAPPPTLLLDAAPQVFPPALVDLARTAANAELVGGFFVAQASGYSTAEAVLWPAGTADEAVPLVRDAAVQAGWRSSPAFLVGPLNGAASFVCPGADPAVQPGFLLAGFEQNGRQVVVLQLVAAVPASACPGS
jgi:hypothetical protein